MFFFYPNGEKVGEAWDFIAGVYQCLENAGARISVGCGHHVHVSAAMVTMQADEFNTASRQKAWNSDYSCSTARRYVSGDVFGDAMPFELLKDVVYRYGTHQTDVNRVLARSRHDNRMCPALYRSVRHNAWRGISNVNALNSHLGGKFCAINVSGFTSRGTVEFRQHQGTLSADKMNAWCKLIWNMFKWSDENRLARDEQTETDAQPFRPSSRNGIAWAMCRSDDGASVQDMMDRIGWTPNNVRRTISEWRSRFGDDVVQTVSQQNNGASYGDGDTHTRYVVRQIVGNAVAILPDNRAGQTSIFAGLDDDTFEFLQERAIELGN